MNAAQRRAQWAARAYLAVFAVVVAASFHLALVLTAGAELLDATAGLRTLRAVTGRHVEDAPQITEATVPAAAVIAVVLLAAVGVAAGLRARRRRRPMQAPTGELATGRQMQKAMSPVKKTKRGQPAYLEPPFALVDDRPLSLRLEDNFAGCGMPRQGKSTFLAVGMVVDAPGAVVVTSTKPDVMRLTAGIRRRRGRVCVFDPEGISCWPESIQWDIVAGCADPEEAAERAGALVASRELGDARNASFFQEAADTVLRCLLHAAALKTGGSMRDVVRWARNFNDDEPYDILRTHPGAVPGWVQDLAKFCRGEARETVSSTDMSLGLVLKAFGLPRMLESVCPARGVGFDSRTFYASTDTLYLLTRPGRSSLAAPIFTALITAIERQARLMAGHTASGRIDPPLDLVLDEVANVAPIRDLGSLMSDGGGRGVRARVFAQSREQLTARYGRQEAKEILDCASALVMLSGSRDVEHLRELSALAGDTWVDRVSTSSNRSGESTQHSPDRQPLLPIERIRTVGLGWALLLYRDAPPTIARLVPWWERKDRAAFEESMRWCLAREGLASDATTTTDLIRRSVEAASEDDTSEVDA